MINCNPETVSTDYDISDRLYFEPLRLENVLDIVAVEKPYGVILQLGGQTPLKLANALQQYGVHILGTSPTTIDMAEDRGKFSEIVQKLHLTQPNNAMVHDLTSATIAAQCIGFPLMVRPSYVLGGRAMQIINTQPELEKYMAKAINVSAQNPILMDKFLQNAIEVDVDVIADGYGNVFVAGIMQHIEPAGVHSGDSASCLPPYDLPQKLQQIMRQQAAALALELKVVGLMNIQFAIQNDTVYVLEVNPRASRTVPFVSKAIGWAVAKIAVQCMLGLDLSKKQLTNKNFGLFAVKQSVFPFNKFPAADPLLGPEMRSTGEVMGFGKTFAESFAKTLEAIHGQPLKPWNKVFLNIDAANLLALNELALELVALNVQIYADKATTEHLSAVGIPCIIISDDATIISLIANGSIDFILSTVSADPGLDFARKVRTLAIKHRVNYATTMAGAKAILLAIQSVQNAMQNESARTAYQLQQLHTVKVSEYEYE